MPQDAFTLKFISKELNALIVGGKISRIIQPSRDSLSFIIYTGAGNVKLNCCLSAQSARLSVEEGETRTPQVAPNFCMLLRKHLQNARILDVKQVAGERIIYFDLLCSSDFSQDKMRLYFEIMGKYSNAVLTQDGVIVGALKTTFIGENTERVLFGGVKYSLPKPQDKADYDDLNSLERVMRNFSGDTAKHISENVRGIAYSTALDMVETYGENICGKDIYEYVHGGAQPCVTLKDGVLDDFKVRAKTDEKIPFDTLLKAQCEYYESVEKKRAFEREKTRLYSSLSSAIKKVEKRLENIYKKLEECDGAEDIKLKGELITANLFRLEKGCTGFTAQNYYDPDGGEIKIDLDRTLTPSQNAQKYYKKYAKLKRTKAAADLQLGGEKEKLDYLKSILSHICAAESLLDLEEIYEEAAALGLIKVQNVKKKKNSETAFRTYDIGGFTVIAGRNNLQNERLTKGISSEDIWLHTQKYHSSHVAILTQGKEVDGAVLKAAAEICAYYSDGRQGNKIPVDYAFKKFVKKPPKTNAGFFVYTDYSTLLVNPDAHTEFLRKL